MFADLQLRVFALRVYVEYAYEAHISLWKPRVADLIHLYWLNTTKNIYNMDLEGQEKLKKKVLCDRDTAGNIVSHRTATITLALTLHESDKQVFVSVFVPKDFIF